MGREQRVEGCLDALRRLAGDFERRLLAGSLFAGSRANQPAKPAGCASVWRFPPVQVSLTAVADTDPGEADHRFLYQMMALPQSAPVPGATMPGSGLGARRPGDTRVAWQVDDGADSGRGCGPVHAGAGFAHRARAERARGRRRADERPAGAALRQPQDRSGQCARRTGQDHDVTFIYTRVGWPVEITAEFENWRRIRDSDGTEGWVYHSLLSGKRTAAVQLKSKTELAPLHDKPDTQSPVTAQLQSGVLGSVKQCTGAWCRIIGDGFDGWISRTAYGASIPTRKSSDLGLCAA